MAAARLVTELFQESAFPFSQDPGSLTTPGGDLPDLAGRQARAQGTDPAVFDLIAHQA